MGGYHVRGKNMSNNKYLEQVSPEVEEFREKFRETKSKMVRARNAPWNQHTGHHLCILLLTFKSRKLIGFRTSRDSGNAYWGQFFCLGISQVSASSAV